MEYCSEGEEDFALYLPPAVVPTKRVLFLRYANRYQALASSLKMRDIAVTGKMPLSITKKDWTMQEDRFAQECDGKS